MTKKNSYIVYTENQPSVVWEFDKLELNQFRQQNFGVGKNIIIVPTHFKPKAVFFDMDSTVVQQESIVELARAVGKSEEVHLITEAAMEGKIDFVSALKQRVAVLQGIGENVFSTVSQSFTLNPGMA
ncbi:hypothetical protein MEO40_26945, partial [Dolichospermum sp. ST_sed1]|nr:hypothetical protein [Dolichospermum sp. ST_sed1]